MFDYFVLSKHQPAAFRMNAVCLAKLTLTIKNRSGFFCFQILFEGVASSPAATCSKDNIKLGLSQEFRGLKMTGCSAGMLLE